VFIIASLAYAISIFIDVFTYHIKLNIHDKNNLRYLFSLINIFQYFARAFVLVFVPIMAYYTETVKDKHVVWEITLLSHFFVIIFLLPLYSEKFSRALSKKIIIIFNNVFGKSINMNFDDGAKMEINSIIVDENLKIDKLIILGLTYVSGFMFSFSITFLYYLSFSYPQRALTLTSISQILNMVGVLLLVLLIDPRIMSRIDEGKGHQEIILLTTSRVFVHITLILILLVIK